MTRPWRRLSVRARLTAAFVAVFGAMLLAYAASTWLVIHDRFTAELDHRLDQALEIAERSLGRDEQGRAAWRYRPDAAVHDAHAAQDDEHLGVSWLEVWRLDHSLVHRSQDAATRAGATPVPALDSKASGLSSYEPSRGTHLRVLQRRHGLNGESLILRAALREDEAERGVRVVLWVLIAGLPVTLMLAAAGGYWLAGRSLAPVARMTDEASRLGAEHLNQRLQVDNPQDELGQLALAFNALFDRLEAAFAQMRRFSADASHELRTPLAALRSVGEVGLRQHHDAAGYRDIIGTMLEEADRLTQLTTTLLDLTRADGGRIPLRHDPIDLADLTRQSAALVAVLAEDKGITISLDLPSQSMSLSGDAAVLGQSVSNILDNAIKYSPTGSQVLVTGRADARTLTLSISDNGPGIAPEHLPHVFERFWRADAARGRSGGFGLGLSIAQWAVHAHGGRIEVHSQPGQGARFDIVLPRQPIHPLDHPHQAATAEPAPAAGRTHQE